MSESAGRSWTGETRGGHLGNLFFVWLVRCGGLALTPPLVFCISLWFLAFEPRGRRVSSDLAERLGRGGSTWRRLRFVRRHFALFGTLLLDRIAILNGCGQRFRFEFEGEEEIERALAQGRGALLVTAHIGNWEVMGQLLERLGTPVTLVMFDGVSPAMRRTLDRLSAGRSFSVLYTDGSPASAAGILAALRRGEIVGMMGDRVFKGRAARVDFLGAPAPFPVSPYVMAATSGAPLLHVFALRTGSRAYRLEAHPSEPFVFTSRAGRQADLERWSAAFAARLEGHLRANPFQWGNFFPFWEGADGDQDRA